MRVHGFVDPKCPVTRRRSPGAAAPPGGHQGAPLLEVGEFSKIKTDLIWFDFGTGSSHFALNTKSSGHIVQC